MSEQNEEEARRRKIILDAEVASLASQNIAGTASGRLSIEQVNEMIEADETWLARTRRCMGRADDDDLPDSPAAI